MEKNTPFIILNSASMKNLFLIILTFISLQIRAATYYFSTTYTGTSDGSQSAPFKSLDDLNNILKNLNATIKPAGNTFLLKRGDVFYGALVPSVSGTAGTPTVIGAYGTGNKPLITAFKRITVWTGTGPIYTASTATLTNAKYVIINNAHAEMGRWPDATDVSPDYGYKKFTSATSTTVTDNAWSTYTKPTGLLTNASIVCRRNRFRSMNVDVNSTTSGTSITFDLGSSDSYVPGFGYYITNSKGTLSKSTEWCNDPVSKLTSVYLSSAPSNYDIRASNFDRLIQFTGESNYTIQDLAFEGASYVTIDINGGSNITVQRCDMKYAWRSHIRDQKCTNFRSLYNNLDQGGNNGIETFSDNGTVIEHNVISNTMPSLSYGSNSALQGSGMLLWGSNHTVRYNRVVNSAYSAISSNNGDNIVIEYNDLDGGCQRISDGGIFYTVQQCYINYNTHKSFSHNVMRNTDNGTSNRGTFSSEKLTMAMYLDQWSNHWTINDNTVIGPCRVGFFANDPHYNTITNNTIIDASSTAIQPSFIQLVNRKVYGTTVSYGFCKDMIDPGPWVTPGTNNNTVTGNVMLFRETGTSIVRALWFTRTTTNTQGPGLPTGFGNVNNNFFVYPRTTSSSQIMKYTSAVETTVTDPTTGKHTTTSAYSGANQTLAQWRTTFNYDIGSVQKTFPTLLTDPYRIITNMTDAPVDYPLNGFTYVSGRNVNYNNNTIRVGSYSTEVLVKTGTISSNVAPVPHFTSPLNLSEYTTDQTVPFRCSPTDADGTISHVEFLNGTTVLLNKTSPPYEYDWDAPAGTFQLSVKVYDNNNAVTPSTPVSVHVSVPTIPNQGPSSALTSPTNGQSYYAPASIYITSDAVDNDGTIDHVDFLANDVVIHTETLAPYGWTWADVPVGTYVLKAISYDDKLKSTPSATRTVTVGTAPPTQYEPAKIRAKLKYRMQ